MSEHENIILKTGQTTSGQRLLGFGGDAIKVMGDDIDIEQCVILDTLGSWDKYIGGMAHRDAIQLIPSKPDRYHGQFALAARRSVLVHRCTILAFSHLQLVFSSDGLLDDIALISNTLYTQGQHWITLNGLRSGKIRGNVRADNGQYAPIYLGAARVGGKSDKDPHPNVWVSSFLNKDDDYQPLESIIQDESIDHVTDERRTQRRAGDIYLNNFDLNGFYSDLDKVTAIDVVERCIAFKELALCRGDVCQV